MTPTRMVTDGAKVISGSWRAPPTHDKLDCKQVRLLLWKTRTVQASLGFFSLLAVAVFVLVIGEKSSSLVCQIGFSLPHWDAQQLLTGFDADELNLNVIDVSSKPQLAKVGLGRQKLGISETEMYTKYLRMRPKEIIQNDVNAGGTVRAVFSRSIDSDVRTTSEGVVSKEPLSAKEGHSTSLPVVSAAKLEQAGHETVEWVQFPYKVLNESAQLMLPIRRNGTHPCHNIRTQRGLVLGLPPVVRHARVQLLAGPIHELSILSVGDDGRPRCAGGDYYETDLSGPRWKSRPPVFDHNNGTYSVKLQVDPRFADVYTFTVILLFSQFHGLHLQTEEYARMEEVVRYELEFVQPKPLQLVTPHRAEGGLEPDSGLATTTKAPHPELRMCRRKDFEKKYWSGRWTREQAGKDCELDPNGRWLCVDSRLRCQKPWCDGRVGRLESNGWVYSAHCAFKIFEEEEAWKCLDKKWLFFWGDSNHMDTIRNLLNLVLGFGNRIKFLDRRMDITYHSPSRHKSSVRITSMFNGHWNKTMNRQGLFSLHHPEFQEQLRAFFTGNTAPDVMIMNSGLHDGAYWKDVDGFLTDGAEFAVKFWTDVWNNMTARRPDILYRTTVCTGGHARNMSFNPQKMELFNHLMVDKLAGLNLERFHIMDGFDYTFPWHYDHKTNDGVHYGRPPSKKKWVDGSFGHQYFVDLMLVHMLLNIICDQS